MTRMPSALALAEAPVRAVVMETDGRVRWFVGLLASVMARCLWGEDQISVNYVSVGLFYTALLNTESIPDRGGREMGGGGRDSHKNPITPP